MAKYPEDTKKNTDLYQQMPAHPSSHHMEPDREEAKRETTKHLAERHRKENKRDGLHQERYGEDGHGQKTVAFLGRWPMFPACKQA